METENHTEFCSNLKHWLVKIIDNVSDIIIKRKTGKDLVIN
jgi:antitoxin YefM